MIKDEVKSADARRRLLQKAYRMDMLGRFAAEVMCRGVRTKSSSGLRRIRRNEGCAQS